MATTSGEQDQALACHEQCVDLSLEMGNKVSEAEEYGKFPWQLASSFQKFYLVSLQLFSILISWQLFPLHFI